jgi:hypothetical protein
VGGGRENGKRTGKERQRQRDKELLSSNSHPSFPCDAATNHKYRKEALAEVMVQPW